MRKQKGRFSTAQYSPSLEACLGPPTPQLQGGNSNGMSCSGAGRGGHPSARAVFDVGCPRATHSPEVASVIRTPFLDLQRAWPLEGPSQVTVPGAAL